MSLSPAFQLCSEFTPAGDQPEAIRRLVEGADKPHQILMGVTGSGKTFTMAQVIETLQRPTLVVAHNKTLAAQLCAEFRQFFPNNAVEYFVSYYDYYQPEAYVAQRDLYIEKESEINEDIERLRHHATRALMSRRDVIIVASVSCIYGLGNPDDYNAAIMYFEVGRNYPRRKLLLELNDMQYQRKEFDLKPGTYRVKGDSIDIYPSWDTNLMRLDFFGDELDEIARLDPVSGKQFDTVPDFTLFPATHYVLKDDTSDAISGIRKELDERVKEFKSEGKEVEAQRITQRTNYDLEMMAEIGYCKGIENYSRHLSGLKAGEPPGVLLDFFPDDFLTVIDESHVTLPQIRGMYGGDQARKQSLVNYGFRLPSALDNRPLQFHEFESKSPSTIYVSATPGNYELEQCAATPGTPEAYIWEGSDVVQQIIRPTGLLDPIIQQHPSEGQIQHLLEEIKIRVDRGERVLVTTVTKKMSEDLANYISNHDYKVRYLHSDIEALERIDILHSLRKGEIDILIGVNLLREGLDLPEVSLVAILDADKEGFLRNERSLIQTMGRAARHVNGTVLLYADRVTPSMDRAITETQRRRKIQAEYNEEHGIKPKSVKKALTDIRDEDRAKVEKLAQLDKPSDAAAIPALIASLQKEMQAAAKDEAFEVAAVLRDRIQSLSDEHAQAKKKGG